MLDKSHNMNVKRNDLKKSLKIWPPRLYGQNEADTLIIKKENSNDSINANIEQEAETVNKQQRQDNITVANLVKKSNRILLSISTHGFPFDFFPDTINIEEGRITVIKRNLLRSEVHSIDIKEVSNIFINTIFIFSQLIIISRTFENNEIRIKNLRPKEAILSRRIIEGLRIFVNKQIDTSSYTKKDLISKLLELSTTEIVT